MVVRLRTFGSSGAARFITFASGLATRQALQLTCSKHLSFSRVQASTVTATITFVSHSSRAPHSHYSNLSTGNLTSFTETIGHAALQPRNFARVVVMKSSFKTRRACFHFITSDTRDCLVPVIYGGSALAIRRSETTSCWGVMPPR